jgi:hypothetical protein
MARRGAYYQMTRIDSGRLTRRASANAPVARSLSSQETLFNGGSRLTTVAVDWQPAAGVVSGGRFRWHRCAVLMVVPRSPVTAAIEAGARGATENG